MNKTEDYSEILKEGERILLQMSDSDDHTCEGWNGIGDENFGKAYIDIKDIFEHPEIKAKLKTIEERAEKRLISFLREEHPNACLCYKYKTNDGVWHLIQCDKCGKEDTK